VNKDQAASVKSLLEAGNPDSATTVTAQPDGVRVTISGPHASPGESGPGTGNVEMILRDDSDLLKRYLLVKAARVINAQNSRAAG
jgi:hypothetical protein